MPIILLNSFAEIVGLFNIVAIIVFCFSLSCVYIFSPTLFIIEDSSTCDLNTIFVWHEPSKNVEQILKCTGCGTKVSKDDKYCHGCGAIFKNKGITCQKCKTQYKENAKYCTKCGDQIIK